MKIIDLRSDTVTQPTPEMREAMAKAALGDDVYGEDPTVNLLQELAAERMGKEAGLFVPSGTMGNLTAVLAHCNRGDEVILGNLGHTFLFEGGGVAVFGGVHPYVLPNLPDGTIDLSAIRAAIRSDDPHFPISRLIVLENTHNRCGGVVLPREYANLVQEIALENSLKMHLDGARIFNAAVAQKTSAVELAKPFDSVTFCLSKGLCAPVGSVLCGSKEFVHRARRIRKALGGGMRQAGILAAAGIIALEKMINRLDEDHQKAKLLAEELSGIPGIRLEYGEASTNMVFLTMEDSVIFSNKEMAAKLRERGILVGAVEGRRQRMVVHYWITDEDIKQVVREFHRVLS
jgi:threonine aldolase